MKKFVWLIGCLLCFLQAEAHHIIGGEMYYVSTGKEGNNYSYQIILKLYRGCEPPDRDHAPLDPIIAYTIFNNDDKSIYKTIENIPLQGPTFPKKQRNDPCIVNPPEVCYQIGRYAASVSLPVNKKGYTIVFQRCCRSDLLLNVYTQGSVGATFFTVIPGTENGIPGDDSPVFDQEEAVLICRKGKVDYDYTASDANGDSLVYSFTHGFGGGNGRNNVPVPADYPPYPSLSYVSGFSEGTPLGPGVKINPRTGHISGRTDLVAGSYDVSVMVSAYRDGKLIAVHRKDFQVDVHDCQRVVLADIPPLFNDCKSATIQFSNKSTTGKTYLWDFGDGTTSDEYMPTHVYKDTGTYHAWLKVDPQSSCGDSMGTEVRIYPGFEAGFSYSGSCLQFPVNFVNTSKNLYGNIDSLSWSFGDPVSISDTSSRGAPSYEYDHAGTFPVTLTVSTDKGCLQTDTQEIQVYDKPPLSVTPDTILCYLDGLTLKAQSSMKGSFQWAPLYRITGQNTATPLVHPEKDTTYRVTFTDEEGCVNTDSVHLRIKTNLLVDAGNDTTVCQGDPVELKAFSDENYAFAWYDSKNDLLGQSREVEVQSDQNETYLIRASLGSCEAEDRMTLKAVPYPVPFAAPDTTLCYGDQVRLRGGGGSSYYWAGPGLDDPANPSPVVTPLDTAVYTLTVTDTLGCPKPVSKNITIGVVPPVKAFAGNDTIITLGHTFQLHASGGTRYTWFPSAGLSNPFIPDPFVDRNSDIQYRVKVATSEGCFAYDSINLRYIKGPAIYVPNAFTPNNDGKNDVFRPVPVGIVEMDYFRVYNRWGQMVFETTKYMEGWNGYFKGKPAVPGGYVWMVKGKDFNGKSIEKKGTLLLIR